MQPARARGEGGGIGTELVWRAFLSHAAWVATSARLSPLGISPQLLAEGAVAVRGQHSQRRRAPHRVRSMPRRADAPQTVVNVLPCLPGVGASAVWMMLAARKKMRTPARSISGQRWTAAPKSGGGGGGGGGGEEGGLGVLSGAGAFGLGPVEEEAPPRVWTDSTGRAATHKRMKRIMRKIDDL